MYDAEAMYNVASRGNCLLSLYILFTRSKEREGLLRKHFACTRSRRAPTDSSETGCQS